MLMTAIATISEGMLEGASNMASGPEEKQSKVGALGMRITKELARNANSQALTLSTGSETLNLNKSFRRFILHKVWTPLVQMDRKRRSQRDKILCFHGKCSFLLVKGHSLFGSLFSLLTTRSLGKPRESELEDYRAFQLLKKLCKPLC